MTSITQTNIEDWFKEGIEAGKTHMLVICSTIDFDSYPVYVSPDEDARVKATHFLGRDYQKLMKVYNLSRPLAEQLDKEDSRNFEGE